MNLIELAPLWLVGLLCVTLIAAAVEDVVRLRISNVTVLLVIALAIVAAALAGPSIDLWQNLLLFAGFLVIGTLLFAAGYLGGGDIKLLAAIALWIDLERALLLLAAVFILGGVLALVFIISRLILRRAQGAARASRKVLPYGVAIAAGALVVIAVVRTNDAPKRPNPLEFRPLPANPA